MLLMFIAWPTVCNVLFLTLTEGQFWEVLITSHLFLINRLTERTKKRRTSSQTIGQTLSNSRQEDTGPTQVRQDASH